MDFAYLWSCIRKGLRSTGLPCLVSWAAPACYFLNYVYTFYFLRGSSPLFPELFLHMPFPELHQSGISWSISTPAISWTISTHAISWAAAVCYFLKYFCTCYFLQLMACLQPVTDWLWLTPVLHLCLCCASASCWNKALNCTGGRMDLTYPVMPFTLLANLNFYSASYSITLLC